MADLISLIQEQEADCRITITDLDITRRTLLEKIFDVSDLQRLLSTIEKKFKVRIDDKLIFRKDSLNGDPGFFLDGPKLMIRTFGQLSDIILRSLKTAL